LQGCKKLRKITYVLLSGYGFERCRGFSGVLFLVEIVYFTVFTAGIVKCVVVLASAAFIRRLDTIPPSCSVPSEIALLVDSKLKYHSS
jgi:hypothetical protein